MAVSYTTNRHGEVFTYRRVSWVDFATADVELEDYSNITGGQVERGAYTLLKTSALISFTGTEPDTTDLLRIYYRFTDEHGENSGDIALGTFLLGYNSVSYTPATPGTLKSGGTVTGYSMLKVLQQRMCGLPLTIPAGTDPIDYAVALMRSRGLRVNVQKNAAYSLANPHTFEPDDTELTVVNWCCSNNTTQYSAPWPDAYGVIQVQPYTDTADAPVWTFADDGESIMQPELSGENEWQSATNVVRLYYEDESTAMWASASNDSGAKSSLDARGGREATYYEQVDEVASLSALQALAVSKLMAEASEIERVTLTHGYCPIGTGDPVAIRYADRSWNGSVQNMTIRLTPGAMTTTQIRRFVPATLDVTVGGAILWS